MNLRSPVLPTILEALKRCGAMTTREIANETGLDMSSINNCLQHHRAKLRCESTDQQSTKFGCVYRWAYDPANDDQRPARALSAAGQTEHDRTIEDRPSDEDQSTTWHEFVPSSEGFKCGRLGRFVTFANCLDGYVDATALRRKSPCNDCPIGAEHRAAYADEGGAQ